jgi:outer membrane lipoprotein
MATLKQALTCLCCALLLGACASPRLTPEQAVLRAVSPAMAVAQPGLHQGRRVEWGGILIATHNRQTHTLLEILAYPLRADGRPDLGQQPMGRFLALRQGYLEVLEFAPGRWVTLSGPITGTRRGQVGERDYLYPAVDAHQLRLWPRQPPGQAPRIHFGFGVGSGSWGAGVGF